MSHVSALRPLYVIKKTNAQRRSLAAIDRLADEVKALILHGPGEIGSSVLGAVIDDD